MNWPESSVIRFAGECGPIDLAQSAEFDYSVTQACKALRQEGCEVAVNSNPATIITHPELADPTCIHPLARDLHELTA